MTLGKRVVDYPKNELNGPFDDWPLIWRRFELEKGYSTALIEDDPTRTLFNYESKGFSRSSPTSFYPRPFWLHMYQNHDISHLCLNKRIPKIEILLNQTKAFIEANSERSVPYFSFTFSIEVTHNDFNRAQLLDSHISHFIESIRNSVNNTILIVMGDHGNRYGPVLKTTIGRIEERMPLFAIHLPKQLLKTYSHLQYFLDENNDKLINWLDLHQLLTDIVEGI